jgi:hypothetical protein
MRLLGDIVLNVSHSVRKSHLTNIANNGSTSFLYFISQTYSVHLKKKKMLKANNPPSYAHSILIIIKKRPVQGNYFLFQMEKGKKLGKRQTESAQKTCLYRK